MSSSDTVKFLEDRFFEQCKSVYMASKKVIVMDDWDAAFHIGKIYAIEEILLAAMSREAVKKQFEDWDNELPQNKSG